MHKTCIVTVGYQTPIGETWMLEDISERKCCNGADDFVTLPAESRGRCLCFDAAEEPLEACLLGRA